MDNSERAIEIERLFKELAEATARRGALLEEAQEFAAKIQDVDGEKATNVKTVFF